MLKVENIEVYGFEAAIRGARNPMNSWDRSDSNFVRDTDYGCSGPCPCEVFSNDCDCCYVGDNDLGLMNRLFKAGVEHRTYARMINVWMDINAPLYWWKEMDRYTVGKVQISTSTMHKIHDKEFTVDDFSHEHLTVVAENVLKSLILVLNTNRKLYNETKDKDYWWQIIQLLPSSYNQKRTVMMSYETVFKIIKERSNHPLDEWNDFVEVLKGLPYMQEIMKDESNLET